MGKLTDKLDAVSGKLRKTTMKIDDTAESARQAGANAKASAEARIDAAEARIAASMDAAEARMEAAKEAGEAKVDAARQKGADAKEAAENKIDAAKQSVADARANAKRRRNETAEKIQGSIDESRAKIEAKKDARDRKKWENYILELLDYAEDCEDSAAVLAAEAWLAYEMALEEAVAFREKYGEEE